VNDMRPDAESVAPRPPSPSDDGGLFRPTPPTARTPQDPPPEEPEVAGSGEPFTMGSPPPQPRRSGNAIQTLFHNWPLSIVLALFAVGAMVIPTMTQIATTDDWAYTRSVEILLEEGRLTVFPVVAATAVGQILWGGLFGALFGMSLGMMRVSTVVMVALGAVALYAILRQLGVTRSRSALGMALWLFNPLTYALAFSFMTDAHFASMMLISLAFSLRGLRPDREHLGFVVAGSFFAGFAFLMRQKGALIPLAYVTWVLLAGRLWFRRAHIRRLLAVGVLPAAMAIGYYLWLRWFNDVPEVQQDFLQDVFDKGWEATWLLARRIPLYVIFYTGLVLVPILVAIRPWRQRERGTSLFPSAAGYYAFAGWAALVLGGLYFAGTRGQEMPFAPQFVGPSGFGPPDVLGSRLRLYERGSAFPVALTIVSAIGALLLGLVLLRKLFSGLAQERWGFWLVASVGFWQLIGIFPPSYHYTNRGVTLDRYLLPVIAILIIMTFFALRDVDLFQPLSWLAISVIAVVSVMGVRDYLVFMNAIWDMGEYANERGVPNDRLDAGSGWDGYHLYTIMLEENITTARSPEGSPWWVYFYAKPTDSSFIVSTDPNVRRGYLIVAQQEYDQWLERDPVYVYLIRRWNMPLPIRWPASPPSNGAWVPAQGGEAVPAATPTVPGIESTPPATAIATPESGPLPPVRWNEEPS
jgi:hypothetical protein